MLADLINSSFELFGAIFISFSIFKLHKEKRVRGISYIHVAYFNIWGFWNLFYYPHLEQWLSFIGGLGVVIANAIWLIQIIYWRKYEMQMR